MDPIWYGMHMAGLGFLDVIIGFSCLGYSTGILGLPWFYGLENLGLFPYNVYINHLLT